MDDFRETKETPELQEQKEELDVKVKDWVDDPEDSDQEKEQKVEADEKLNNVSFGQDHGKKSLYEIAGYCPFAGGSGSFR